MPPPKEPTTSYKLTLEIKQRKVGYIMEKFYSGEYSLWEEFTITDEYKNSLERSAQAQSKLFEEYDMCLFDKFIFIVHNGKTFLVSGMRSYHVLTNMKTNVFKINQMVLDVEMYDSFGNADKFQLLMDAVSNYDWVPKQKAREKIDIEIMSPRNIDISHKNETRKIPNKKIRASTPETNTPKVIEIKKSSAPRKYNKTKLSVNVIKKQTVVNPLSEVYRQMSNLSLADGHMRKIRRINTFIDSLAAPENTTLDFPKVKQIAKYVALKFYSHITFDSEYQIPKFNLEDLVNEICRSKKLLYRHSIEEYCKIIDDFNQIAEIFLREENKMGNYDTKIDHLIESNTVPSDRFYIPRYARFHGPKGKIKENSYYSSNCKWIRIIR